MIIIKPNAFVSICVFISITLQIIDPYFVRATPTFQSSSNIPTWQQCMEQVGISSITNAHAKCFSEPIKRIASKVCGGVVTNQQTDNNLPDSHKNAYEEDLKEINATILDLPRGYYAEIYFLKGYVQELLGDYKSAFDSYKVSLSWSQYNTATVYRISVVTSLLKQHKESLNRLKEVIWLKQVIPPNVLVDIGFNLIELKQDELATNYLRQAADSIPPASTQARKLLVGINDRLIQKATSHQEVILLEQNLVNLLQAIMYANTTDRDTGLKLSQLLLAHSDPLTGEGSLNKAANISRSFVDSSNYKDSDAVAILVRVLIKQRKLDEAGTVLLKGLNTNPSQELYNIRDQLELEKAAIGL